MGITTNKKRIVKDVLVAKINMIRAPREKRKVTNSLVIVANVKIYLGIYIFFNKFAFPNTEVSDLETALTIKVKSKFPLRR
jgi:hypothetical protein